MVMRCDSSQIPMTTIGSVTSRPRMRRFSGGYDDTIVWFLRKPRLFNCCRQRYRLHRYGWYEGVGFVTDCVVASTCRDRTTCCIRKVSTVRIPEAPLDDYDLEELRVHMEGIGRDDIKKPSEQDQVLFDEILGSFLGLEGDYIRAEGVNREEWTIFAFSRRSSDKIFLPNSSPSSRRSAAAIDGIICQSPPLCRCVSRLRIRVRHARLL
jgi:hypothetical protein